MFGYKAKYEAERASANHWFEHGRDLLIALDDKKLRIKELTAENEELRAKCRPPALGEVRGLRYINKAYGEALVQQSEEVKRLNTECDYWCELYHNKVAKDNKNAEKSTRYHRNPGRNGCTDSDRGHEQDHFYPCG